MIEQYFERLLRILVKETTLQEKFLTILAEERSCIVKLQTKPLEEIQKKKEKLLAEISSHAKERSQVLLDLGVPPPTKHKEPVKLTDLIQSCESIKTKNALEKVCKELKESASSTKKLNTENGDLLKRSLGLVSNTISIINARPSIEDNNYKRNGKTSSESLTPTLNTSPISSFKRSA
jgi:flagellar biosynthesis/type III secretory pathway chaperone